MIKLTNFEDSDFVVTWTGECPESRVIRGWDRVLAFIDYAASNSGDGWSCRDADNELHDPDNWSRLGCSGDDGDERHCFDKNEYIYCSGLHIVRLTEPISETILATELA